MDSEKRPYLVGSTRYVTVGNMSNPVTFPIAFPTKALNVVTILQTDGDGGNMSKNRLYIKTLTTTGFSIQNPQGSYRYYALGC